MNSDNSIKNILNNSKVLETKISNFKSNIVKKEDFLTIIKRIKNSIYKILEKILKSNQTFSNSKLLEKD